MGFDAVASGAGHYRREEEPSASQATLNTANQWHKFGTPGVPNIANQRIPLMQYAHRKSMIY